MTGTEASKERADGGEEAKKEICAPIAEEERTEAIEQQKEGATEEKPDGNNNDMDSANEEQENGDKVRYGAIQ